MPRVYTNPNTFFFFFTFFCKHDGDATSFAQPAPSHTPRFLFAQGGAITLSGDDDEQGWDSPGGTLILRNSTFFNCTGDLDSGGVIYLNDYSIATIEGDGNR